VVNSGWDRRHAEPDSLFPAKHGEALDHELELLVSAGMPTVDALRAATSIPAKYFNLSDLGGIEVGKRADLVLTFTRPYSRHSTSSIQRVWRGSTEVATSS